MKQAIVVGAGISGIAAATRLVEHGVETTLFEADLLPGGRIGATFDGPAEIDLGGRNFSLSERRLTQLFASYESSDFVDYRFNSVSVGGRGRFDGRRDGSALDRVKRTISNGFNVPVFNLLRLARVSSAARRKSGSDMLCSPYWIRLAEDNADPSATSYFGGEVTNKVLRPWTLRMMAAEPDEVYLGNLGPLLGVTPTPLKRLRDGMGPFLRMASSRLKVQFAHKVTSVIFSKDRAVGVEGILSDGSAFSQQADLIVVATPAKISADLVSDRPLLANVLSQIIYHDVATVVARYSELNFEGGVAGIFLPRGAIVSHIARYDNQSRLRFSFAGVAARRAMVSSSVEELLELGEDTFRQVGGRLGERLSFVGKIWKPGLCAHTWQHHRTLDAINDHLEAIPGLVLTGDYFRGNSLNACVGAAIDSVERKRWPNW